MLNQAHAVCGKPQKKSGLIYSRVTPKVWFKHNAVLNMKELAEFLQQTKVQLYLKHEVVQLIFIANSWNSAKYRMFIQPDKELKMFTSSNRISRARIFFSRPASISYLVLLSIACVIYLLGSTPTWEPGRSRCGCKGTRVFAGTFYGD